MMFATSVFLALALTASSSLVAKADQDVDFSRKLGFLRSDCNEDKCKEVTPLGDADFNLDTYISKSWYAQKQQVTPYLDEDDFYCVVATYNTRDDGFIQVLNSANEGSVDGEPTNPDTTSCFSAICAEQVEAGELRVAPCWLKLAFCVAAGPYYVLAVGDDGSGGYSWAIVSGGQPDQERETVGNQTLCTTKSSDCFLDTNGSGLWLFTRESVATDATIATMEAKLIELGISTTDLKNVTQAGCTYPDTIKS